MERKNRFAILTLAFYGADTLPLMLKNTGGYVDRIYISHSKVPWKIYNTNARNQFKSELSDSFFETLPYRSKITLLVGEWESDEDQRNHALNIARKDGIDYLIVQDADEFYMPEAFLANLKDIEQNPDYPAYRCPWTVFWKNLNYVIQVREHNGLKATTVTTCPNFAVNLKMKDVRFSTSRLLNRMNEAFLLKGLCFHLAWVLSDEDVFKKIQTWGHSHQFDHLKWYRQKWLAWQPRTRYIGHITRANYLRAVVYTGMLPKELIGFNPPKQVFVPLGFGEKISSFILDYLSLVRVFASGIKRYLTRKK